jgi:energy-coupling factor transporter ATP-binding protein EcfA2
MYMSNEDRASEMLPGPRVVVVGPCASGKSTLVRNLRDLGIDARVSGQEHSAIRNLWQTLSPDLLIALDIDLETVRTRRSANWPENLYDVQHARLREAFEVADALVDTAKVSEEEVVALVLDVIHQRHPS